MKQGGVFKSVALDFQDSLSDYLIIFSDAVRVRKTAEACAIWILNNSGDLKAYNLKVIEFETYTYQTKGDWHNCWFQTDYCEIKIKFSLILL